MKKIIALFIILPAIMLAACAPQEMQSTSSASVPGAVQETLSPPSASVPPLTYNSIDEFIKEVKSLKEGNEQTWIEKYHNIDQIDWYYDFKAPVKDVELYSVDANSLSIKLYYRDKEVKESDGLLLVFHRQQSNDPANEEKFLKSYRAYGYTIDVMINGHKGLKGENYGDDPMTAELENIFICNDYYWLEDGDFMFMRIPAWLLERYPEETFFDIEKVEIEKQMR